MLADSFKITERRCKVCMSPLRDRVDLMLLGEERRDDGNLYRYADIVDVVSAHGLDVSEASLSRHRSAHLQPAVMAALESQRAMDAIAAATGKKLSLHQAMVNVVISKLLTRLNEDEALDGVGLEKALRIGMRASEVGLKIEKAERVWSAETTDAMKGKLRERGLSEEVIREIEESVLGLSR